MENSRGGDVHNAHEYEIARRCRRLLAEHYESRLAGVILYGSAARGTATEDSDIDLLVLLHEPFDFYAELGAIVDALYPLQLESDRHISARPASAARYQSGAVALYRNARKEGIAV